MMILDKLIQDRLNGKNTHKVIFPASKNGFARAERKGRMEISITPLLAAALAACTGDNIGRPLQQPGAGGGPGTGGGPSPSGPTDAAPTALTVTPQSAVIDEDVRTAQKLADITFTDDDLGTNMITLPTGSIFEIRPTTIRNSFELWLRADVSLDFETQNRYTVTLTPTVTGTGNPPPAQIFTLNVNNVPEPTPQSAPPGQAFRVQLEDPPQGQTYTVESVIDESGRSIPITETGWLAFDTTTNTLSGTPRTSYEAPAARFSFVASTVVDAQGNSQLHLTPVFEGEAGYEPSAGKQIFVDTGRTKTITVNGQQLTYSILEPIGPGDTGYVAPTETASDLNRFFLVTIRRSDGEAFSYYISTGEPPVMPVFEGGRDDNDMELPIILNLLENTQPMSATVEGRFSPAGDSSTSYTVQGATPLPTSAPDSLTTYTISGGVVDTSQMGFTHRVDGMHGRLFFNMETGAYRYIGTASETFTVTMTNDDDTSREVEIEIEVPLTVGDPTHLGDLRDYVTNADEIDALSFAFADNVPTAIRELFAIDGSQLRYVGPPQDYEAAGGTRTWTFDIIVTDMDSPENARRQDTATITVNLENIAGTVEPLNILGSIAHRIIDTPAADDFADVSGSFPTFAGAGASLTYTVSRKESFFVLDLESQTLQRWDHSEWHPLRSGETPAESVITYLYRQEDGSETTYRLVLGAERTGRTEVSAEIRTKLSAAVADTSQSGYTHRVDGKYGDLFFNSRTGTYKYVPNDDAINGLAAGQTDTEEFQIIVNDGTGNSVPKTLTININGGGDRLNFDASPELTEPPEQPPLSDYLSIINEINAKGVLGISGGVTYKTTLDNALRALFARTAPPARETSVTIEDGEGGSRTAPVAAGTVVEHRGNFYTQTEGVFGAFAQNGIYAIDENADGSSTAIDIGRPVTATDADGNPITYSLASPPADFEIDSGTGQISYTGTGLNYEESSSISLTVVATSTNGRIEKTVTILVRNLPEPLTLQAITPHTITDTTELDDFEDIDGAFVVDHDGSFNIEYKVRGQVVDTSQSGYTHRVDGRYGDLFFNEDTGTYKYVPNDNVINGLGPGREDSDSFEVYVLDRVAGLNLEHRQDRTDLFVSNSQLLTINIEGGDDAVDFVLQHRVARINRDINEMTVTQYVPVHEMPATFTLQEGTDYSGGFYLGSFASTRPVGTDIRYTVEGAPRGFSINIDHDLIYNGPVLGYDRYRDINGDTISGTPIIEFTVVATVGSTRIERPVVIQVLDVDDESPELDDTVPFTVTDTRDYDDFPDATGQFVNLESDYSFRAPDSVVGFTVTRMSEGATIDSVVDRSEIVGTRTSTDGGTATIFSTHRIDGEYGSFFYHSLLGYYKYVRDDAALNAVPAAMNPDDVFSVTMYSVGPDGVVGTGDDLTDTASYTFRIRGAADNLRVIVPNDLTVAENQDGGTTPILVGSPITARVVDTVPDPVTNAFHDSSFYGVRITADAAGPAGNNIEVRLVYDSTRTGSGHANDALGIEVRGAGTSADPYIITVYTTFNGISHANLKATLDGHTTRGTGDTETAANLIDITILQPTFFLIDVQSAGNTITFDLGQAVDSVVSYVLQDSDDNTPTDFAIDDMGQISYTGPALDYNALTEEQRTVTLTVVATLASGGTQEQDVTIQITRGTFVFTVPPRLEILEGEAGTDSPIPVGDPVIARDLTATGPAAFASSYSLRDADGNAPANFVIDDMGHIYYTGTAFDYSALTAEQREITLTVVAEKDGRTVAQDVTISVTTLPTLTLPAAQIFVRDTANTVDTSFSDLTGQFTGSDVEGDPIRFTVEGQVEDTSKTVAASVQSTHRVDGVYGTLYFNEGTGHYAYVTRDAATVEGMQSFHSWDDDFRVRATDGFYQTAAQGLRVSLEGNTDVFEFSSHPNNSYTIDENRDGSATPVSVTNFVTAIVRSESTTQVTSDGVTYRLEGAPDDFQIARQANGGARIQYTGTGLDFETATPIIFTVIASHDDHADIKRIVVVTVNDVAEDAVLELTDREIVDTPAMDEFEDLTGQFVTRGADHDGTTGYTITGETELDATNHVDARNLREGFTHKAVGTYGTLYFNSILGHYKYVADDAAVNAVGAAGATESFEVRTFTASNAYSGSGASITNTITRSVASNAQNFNINIIGADGDYVLSIPDDLTFRENVMLSPAEGRSREFGSPIQLVDAQGNPVSATYSLEGGNYYLARHALHVIKINFGTGQLRYQEPSADTEAIDRETTPLLPFTVVATAGGVTYRAPVTVRVTNQVESLTIDESNIYHWQISLVSTHSDGTYVVLDQGMLSTGGGDGLGGIEKYTYTITDNSDAGNFEILGDHDNDPATPDTWQAVVGTSGSAVNAIFTQADVNAGRVRYVPTDASANTDVAFSFSVTVIYRYQLTVNHNGQLMTVLKASNFPAIDPTSGATPTQLTYRIVDNSDAGNFEILGDHDDDANTAETWQAVSGTQASPETVTFTKAQLDAGKVRYVPATNTLEQEVTFDVTLTDAALTAGTAGRLAGTLNIGTDPNPVYTHGTRPSTIEAENYQVALDPVAHSFTDTAADDSFDAIFGALEISGGPTNSKYGVRFEGQEEDTTQTVGTDSGGNAISSTHKVVGIFGTLYFHDGIKFGERDFAGMYKYVPNSDAINAVGSEGSIEVFQMRAAVSFQEPISTITGTARVTAAPSNPAHNSDLQSFVISITGADDTTTTEQTDLTLAEGQDGSTTPIIVGKVRVTDRDAILYELVGAPAGFAISPFGQIFYTGTKTDYDALTMNQKTSITVSRGGVEQTVTLREVTLPNGFDGSDPRLLTIVSNPYSLVDAPEGFHIAPSGQVSYTGTKTAYEALTVEERTVFTVSINGVEHVIKVPLVPYTGIKVSFGDPLIIATFPLTQPNTTYGLIVAADNFEMDATGRILYTGTAAQYNALTAEQKTFFVVSINGALETVTLPELTIPATSPYSLVGAAAGFTIDALGNVFYGGTKTTYDALTDAEKTEFTVSIGGVERSVTLPELELADGFDGSTTPMLVDNTIAHFIGRVSEGIATQRLPDITYSLVDAPAGFTIDETGRILYQGTAAAYNALTDAEKTEFTVSIDGVERTVTLPELTIPAASPYSLVGAATGFTIDALGNVFYGGTKTAYDALLTPQKTSFKVSAGGMEHSVTLPQLSLPDGFDGSTTPMLVGSAASHFIGRVSSGLETQYQPDITYSLVSAPAGFEIDSATGQIRYTGTAYDYETLSESDRTITFMVDANGVQETVTITIADVSDNAPVVVQNTIFYDQTQKWVVLTREHLSTTDADPTDEAGQLTYTITSLPSAGKLQIWTDANSDTIVQETEWSDIAQEGTFTQADVNAGRVRYVPSDTDNSGFTFSVADGGGDMLEDQTLNVEKVYKVTEDSARFNTDSGQINNLIYVRQTATSPNIAVGGGTDIEGTYGTLTVNPGGAWSYALNNDNIMVDMLDGGGTLTIPFALLNLPFLTDVLDDGGTLIETFQYFAGETERGEDGYLRAVYRTLTIIIEGRTDATVTTIPAYDQRASTDDLVVRVESPEGAQDIRTGAGDDVILVGATAGGKTVYAGAGNDEVYAGAVGSLTETLLGEDGDDYLYGNTKGDTIRGGNGDDYIEGRGGVDQLIGNDGNDEIHGGDGNDVIRGSDRNDNSDGNDLLYGDAGNDEIYGGMGHDTIYGGADHDALNGDAGNDILYGGRGGDTLNGGAGDDMLYGMAGSDTLNGGADQDTLMGGNGVDTLSGGAGTDILIGGDGNDKFILAIGNTQASDYDIVTDFTSGDVIRVDSPSGDLSPTLTELMGDVNIRWTQDSNYNTGTDTNDASTNDAIIYATLNTAATTDDVVIMVLEDYSTALTTSDFEVY